MPEDPTGFDLVGHIVRFVHQPDGPVHLCVATKGDGSMVEIMGFEGWFAPHLFVLAEDSLLERGLNRPPAKPPDGGAQPT